MPFRPAKIDEDVLALDITEVAKSISKSLEPTFHARGRACTEKTDARRPRRLRPRRKRPRRRRAAEQSDERAAPHSITSSARTRVARIERSEIRDDEQRQYGFGFRWRSIRATRRASLHSAGTRVMNSRRLIRSPRRRGRAASTGLRGRAPWRS